MFADVDTRYVGGDGLEFAPNLGGGIHFEVVHVLMGWCPHHVDHDHRFVTGQSLRLFGTKQLRQA
jgi:hypothetical protein